MADSLLSVAQIVPCTEAEGPGKRFALWLQGCPLRCPECCNPEMLSFSGGQQRLVSDILAEIDHTREKHGIEGITLLGGEPMAHATNVIPLARAVQQRGLSVMIFSGYLLSEIQDSNHHDKITLLSLTDILVDGPYLKDQPETQRRWIGSSNQRIHFLTNRYQSDDPCWQKANTLEIRWDGQSLMVNGFPQASAAGLWQRGKLNSTVKQE